MCKYIFPEDHAKASQQCGSKGDWCRHHAKYQPVVAESVIAKLIVAEPVIAELVAAESVVVVPAVAEPTMTKSIEEIYGEHCIQHIKSVDKYDETKLGDSRVLSPSIWIKSKMHVVGDSINYKHSDDGTPDFGNDGYTYLLQYQFNELDESQMLDNFFFKSNEDRESFEQANVECGVEYFLATQSYDERLYQLCMMIRGDWFSNNQNVWNLAGFFARQPHSDWHLVRKTYLCVLKQKSRAFQQGKDDYEVKEPWKTATSKTFELSTLDQDFELTFKSERKLATLTQLVELTGRTINDMRSAMVDTSFENDELEYWAEKYLVIENKPNRDFDLNQCGSSVLL
ncbi:hypothetical protein GN244_ATG19331 [Phytophthora infestans]|uniref:Uncharacterized protein n=1 Tax=Phytophthora infestans TaxID=4787 RepID=A0A833VU96_PHYIN|nr:hypothetical protein GN244_ATG19331 [Phytophthora infestans]